MKGRNSKAQRRHAKGLYGQRRSASADAARREEFEAAKRMTPRDRVLLALRLGRRARELKRRSDRESKRG